MLPIPGRKLFWSLFAVLAVALALSGSVDRLGEANAAEAFKRALVTFAVSRALNGAISVAQGTELALEPAGVGVILTLGQVLDPINDLVERFSTVMLVATSSLALQNLLLDITSAAGFDLALGLVAVFVLATAWLPWRAAARGAQWSKQVFLALIFVRFAVPLLVILTSLVFETWLEAEQTAAVSALEGVQTGIEEINEEPPVVPGQDESLMDQLGAMLDRSLDSIDLEARLERLRIQVSEAAEHIISLIVIFVLQTVLLPVAFIWLFVELLKSVARRLIG